MISMQITVERGFALLWLPMKASLMLAYVRYFISPIRCVSFDKRQ